MTRAQGWLLIGAVWSVAAMAADDELASALFALAGAINCFYGALLCFQEARNREEET